jgi:peptide/nickel transport system permease protein
MVLKTGQQNLDTAWWVAVAPGIMLFLTVLAFNFMGDGLRDAFDPRRAV